MRSRIRSACPPTPVSTMTTRSPTSAYAMTVIGPILTGMGRTFTPDMAHPSRISIGPMLLGPLAVEIAVLPVLAGLCGPDDRVPRRVGVLRRVLADRLVAAADVTADDALAQVHPGLPDLQALLAALGPAPGSGTGAVRMCWHSGMSSLLLGGPLRRASAQAAWSTR